jgi:hypothetical protein
MENYVRQLLTDIAYSTGNVVSPYIDGDEMDIHDWISSEEEDATAPVRDLEEWTGIRKEQLPPQEMLSDELVTLLLGALIKMLDAYNWSFVMQISVPERIQYAAIRDYFDQPAKIKRWHMGFFEYCRPDTELKKCALGEYCHCAFFQEFFAGLSNEELSPEEERAMELRCEIKHLQGKYGDEWEKYYPYHLDPSYDDENGNPHDYGWGSDEEEDEDDWWKK